MLDPENTSENLSLTLYTVGILDELPPVIAAASMSAEESMLTPESAITTASSTSTSIRRAYYTEKSENVRKIQNLLKLLSYWTDPTATATSYFGKVTKASLIKFQKDYMGLTDQKLYNSKGQYVGCGPRTAAALSILYDKYIGNTNGIQYVPWDYAGSLASNQKRVPPPKGMIPTIYITQPNPIVSDSYSITATLAGASIMSIQVYYQGNLVAAGYQNNSNSYTLTFTPQTAGTYTVKAFANGYSNNAKVSTFYCQGTGAYIIFDKNLVFMKDQADDEFEQLENQYGVGNVKKIRVSSASEFKSTWNNMVGNGSGGKISNVTLIFHGNPFGMAVSDANGNYTYIVNDSSRAGTNDVVIRSTSFVQKKIGFLNLSSCNTGHLDVDNNIAKTFLRNQVGIESVKAWDGTTLYIELIHQDIIYPMPFGQESFEKYASNRVQWYPGIGWAEPPVKGKRDPLGGVLYSRGGNGNIVAHSYLIPNIRYEKNSDGYIIPIQE